MDLLSPWIPGKGLRYLQYLGWFPPANSGLFCSAIHVFYVSYNMSKDRKHWEVMGFPQPLKLLLHGFLGFCQHLWPMRNWAAIQLPQVGLETPVWVEAVAPWNILSLFLFFCTEETSCVDTFFHWRESLLDTITARCELAYKKCPITLNTTSLVHITQGLWYRTACAGKG